VFWPALACFLLWIAYGVYQSRRSDLIRQKMSGLSRGGRAGLGAALMIGGAVALVGGGVLLEQIGALTKSGITPIGWLLVAIVGLGFVHAQTIAFAMLVSLAYDAVTNPPRSPSDQQHDKGTNHDEASPDLP
jgi:hypothetical protein